MKPFFSIIVPCCEVAPCVRECLDSVIGQSFTAWECLIGVETSTDATEEIVRSYAAREPRFRIFTGPRSGGCSTSRNRGIEMAKGEYVIFLDGDDTIAEGALQRLHDRIAACPGADLYPCAIRVRYEGTERTGELRDNYPPDFDSELTGPAATLMIYRRLVRPHPMLQMTVFRSVYLQEKGLKCLKIRWEDNEFSPRALYLAARVRPLHEAFYIYRIRKNSISSRGRSTDDFLRNYAIVLKSLLTFHAVVSRQTDFNREISVLWARQWLNHWLFYYWFGMRAIRNISRATRLECLRVVFSGGFDDFDLLCRASTFPSRLAVRMVKLAVRHPSMAWLTDAFFRCFYYPLVGIRNGLRRKK